MIITYNQVESFKIQFGDFTLALNPVSKDSKFKSSRFGADVVLISLNDKDFNGVDTISLKDKQPLVISCPGEYETKGVFVKGFSSLSMYGGQKRINTVYLINLEGINIGYLGALGVDDLSDEIKSSFDEVDILFVPIGGDGVLNSSTAHKIAVKFNAKIIIPMHYGEVGDKDALKKFLKDSGMEDVEPEEKLTIKKKDFEGEKNGTIVVLKQSLS